MKAGDKKKLEKAAENIWGCFETLVSIKSDLEEIKCSESAKKLDDIVGNLENLFYEVKEQAKPKPKLKQKKDIDPNYFWDNIPDDCKKPIAELKRMKVFRCCGFDYEETFADVWWLVLHEVDLYEEGEFCREASRSRFGDGDPSAMNLKQAQAADRWLVRYEELFNKYKDSTGQRTFSDGYYHYGGQLI